MKIFSSSCFAAATVLALWLTAPSTTSAATSAAPIAPREEIPVFIADQSADGTPTPGMLTITGIIGLVAAESGLNLVVRPYPWRRAQANAQNGDGLLFGAAETTERVRIFSFTRPLYEVHHWLVTTAQQPINFRSMADLRGKAIAIPSGAHFGAEFEAQRGKTFTVEENAVTTQSRFKMLDSGRVDIVLMDSSRPLPQLEARLNCLYPGVNKWVVSSKPLNEEPVQISVSRSSALLSHLPLLNDAIERLVKANAIQKFLERRASELTC